MSFVTKAVAITGATAVVALGGFGAITNLTGSVAAAQAPTIVAAANMAASGATCTPWALTGGDFIEQATPGTTAVSTCTVNVSGADANTTATVALADGFETPTSLKKVFAVSADVQNPFNADVADGEATLLNTGSTSGTLVITVTARIPNADVAEIDNEDAAKELTEALSNVVVTFDQAPYLGIPTSF